MKSNFISALLTIRHPGESRGPINSFHPISVSRVVLIQGIPAFAGMTGWGRVRTAPATRSLMHGR